jgi:hypothetical protein
MRASRALAATFAVAALCGLSSPADATTAVLLTREEMVARSEVVARVHVGKAVTGESDDHASIVTRTEITVDTCLKGPCDERFTIEQIGGTYQGKTQRVTGDARLSPGEDAVVFFRRGEHGRAYLTALALSVYHVDAKGVARRDLGGLTLVRREAGKLTPAEVAESPEPVESLMTDIVRIAGGSR